MAEPYPTQNYCGNTLYSTVQYIVQYCTVGRDDSAGAHSQKKDLVRRQGKGRGVGVGDSELNRLFQKDRGKTASPARGTVELNRLFQKDRGKTASAVRGTVELNGLFQKERSKTASAPKFLSLNPTRRPLPGLLIQSFFNASSLTHLALTTLNKYYQPLSNPHTLLIPIIIYNLS